jgi:hypothetical protein
LTSYTPQNALAAAKEKLRLAEAKLAAMRDARTLDELATLWEEFVAEQHRVFLRLRKATEHGPGKGWFDQIINEQRSDELLKYLLHARDAAEHGIEKITEKKPSRIGIGPKQGNKLEIGYLELKSHPGGIQMIKGDPKTMEQIAITFVPGKVQLVAVTDRGTIYQPPTSHLGKAIGDVNPISVAELAVAYLDAKVGEAEAKYVK